MAEDRGGGGVGVVELPVTRDYQACEICLVHFEMFFEYKMLTTLRWQVENSTMIQYFIHIDYISKRYYFDYTVLNRVSC